jgi:integrase
MASFRKRGAVWYFRFVDERGAKVERKGCPDRRATEELARAAESEVARTKAGLSDPKAERMAREARRPIREHLAEFIAGLDAKGDDPRHVRDTRRRVNRLLSLARIDRVAELTPSAVMQAVAALKAKDLSAQCLNHHVTAIKSFSRWLKRDGRTADYALETLTKFNVEADRRRIRRALTPEEAARVIQCAEVGPPFRKMTGPARVILYLVAAGTGFRASELRTLTPESFDLDGDPPTVTVKAAYSKRRRNDAQPIPAALVERLRPWLAARPSGEPVFSGWTRRTAEMLRLDLGAAGIPYETDEGVVDFHALRAAYITNLVNSGASVKTCQTLARHSTPTLTIGVYAKASLHDVAGAVEGLPDLTSQAPTPLPLAMTGTDPATAHISERFAHHLPTGGDFPGCSVMLPDVMAGSEPQTLMEGKCPKNKALDASRSVVMTPDAGERARSGHAREQLDDLLPFRRNPCRHWS